LIPFLIHFLAFLKAFFRSRHSLGLEIPVSNWAYSSENILALGYKSRTEYFEFCSAVFGESK
jgi:hypothetical protein